MTKDEADKLIATIRSFVAQAPPLGPGSVLPAPQPPKGNGKPLSTETAPTTNSIGEPRSAFTDGDLEQLYQAFKARLIDDSRIDPILLQLLTQRPEIVVEVEPRVVTLEGSSLKGRVARLIAQGWLKEPQATSAIRYELARTGPDPGGGGRLSEHLNALLAEGFLVRAGDRWQAAPGVKVTERQIAT